MRSVFYRYKSGKDLPILASPLVLFLVVWALMLGSLRIQIAQISYPGLFIPFLLFGLSLAGFLCGQAIYMVVSRRAERKPVPIGYEVNVPRLRLITWFMVAVAVGIILMNLALDGLPPIVGLLGVADTADFHHYGRLLQIMGPLLYCLSINSLLDPSKLRRVLYIGGGVVVLLLYQTRGGLLVLIVQLLFAFMLMTRWSKTRLVVLALGIIVVGGIGFSSLGDLREAGYQTRDDYLEIRPEYREYPSAFVWVVSYLSTSFSNMCWVVEQRPPTLPSMHFLQQLLPVFARDDGPQDSSGFVSVYMVNYVHTYLYDVYCNFWYFGVVGINLALGAASAFFVDRRRSKHLLTFSVFMSYLALIFFFNYFIEPAAVLQFLVESYVQRKTLIAVPPAGHPG
jgi:oligosaccharide repeat unit polymerase